MKNHVHALHRAAHGGAVENGSLDELVLQARQVVPEAGAQIVQHAHLGPALKMFDDVAADESGAAGDQNFHSNGFHQFVHPLFLLLDGLNQFELRAAAVKIVIVHDAP